MFMGSGSIFMYPHCRVVELGHTVFFLKQHTNKVVLFNNMLCRSLLKIDSFLMQKM